MNLSKRYRPMAHWFGKVDDSLVMRMKHELALRSHSAVIGSSVLCVFLLSLYQFSGGRHSLIYLFSITLLTSNFGRGWVARNFLKGALKVEHHRFFGITVLGSAISWSLLVSTILFEFGLNHLCSNMGLLILSGVSAAALVALAPAPKLLSTFLGTVLLPPAFVTLYLAFGHVEMSYSLLYLLYLLFLRDQATIYSRLLIESLVARDRVDKDRGILQTTIDTVPGFIACVGDQLELSGMNKRLREQLARKGQDNRSAHLGGLFSDQTEVNEISRFIASNEKLMTREVQLPVHDEVRWHLSCLRKSDDENRMVWIAIDIDHEKKLSLEADQQRAKIQSSAKMSSLGEMAGGIAHEINNPLAIIIGKIEQIRERLENEQFDRAKTKQDLLKVETTALRIAKIVKGLRSFSRNSDKDPMEAVVVSQVIGDTLELCQERFRNHGVELRVELNKLDQTEPTLVSGRSAQLSQVFLNLFNNAFDAVETLPDRWVLLVADVREHQVIFRIIDSGNGIAPDITDKIMLPFFTTKDVGRGTGLGLSISQGIVQEHGGRLTYFAGMEHTCFIVELPRKRLAVESRQPERKRVPAA